LEVVDVQGRTISKSGLNLLDWDGYVANPAVKFFLIPPSDATYPAKAVLTAAEPRLHFDLPSEIGPDGPRKEVVWHQREELPLYLSIFPDRDGEDEHHRLQIEFHDAHGNGRSLNVPVRVIDQDQTRAAEFSITVDFSQDRTGFFQDENRRAVVVQAARDWAYFFADMKLMPVASGTEKTLIWGSDGFKSSTKITNANEYRGFLLYAYGIRNELVDSKAKLPRDWVLRKRDPTARMIRSGGEPSPFGGFQVAAGTQTSIRRSGGLEIEVKGNYNTRGWLVILPDADWWKATNQGDVVNDLYSIAHHEIGHTLIFNPNNTLVKRGQTLENKHVRAYLGSSPALSNSDHLEGVLDPASLRGAFGNEYHGRMPGGRWLITKLDLLYAQAIGYELRETSALEPEPGP
jgi:hypothetical protein